MVEKQGNRDAAHVVVITGMSGAGRSTAANVLEDLGYFVVDNLPTPMIPDLIDAVGVVDGDQSRIAVVTDTRSRMEVGQLDEAVIDLEARGVRTTVLFLTASRRVLARRFSETRRVHPAAGNSLAESIESEAKAFEPVRELADVVIDTSELNVHQLRDRIGEAFAAFGVSRLMRVNVTSFGHKRGLPRVADVMFDVRFLPNPHWDPELRPLTGLDAPVREFVLTRDGATDFLSMVNAMLEFLIPRYEAEGKSYLTIAVGCTGGRHRSVAMAVAINDHLARIGVQSTVHHRDINV